jgi:hypothetical protein
MSHQLFAELITQLSLERLAVIVGDHLVRRAIHDFQISFLDLVCKEEITNVKGTCSTCRTFLTVVKKKDSAFVVLIEDVTFDFITLGFHKEFSPKDRRRHVIATNEFAFSTAASIEFLLTGIIVEETASKSKTATGVAFEVWMDCEGDVDIPLQNVKAVGGKD